MKQKRPQQSCSKAVRRGTSKEIAGHVCRLVDFIEVKRLQDWEYNVKLARHWLLIAINMRQHLGLLVPQAIWRETWNSWNTFGIRWCGAEKSAIEIMFLMMIPDSPTVNVASHVRREPSWRSKNVKNGSVSSDKQMVSKRRCGRQHLKRREFLQKDADQTSHQTSSNLNLAIHFGVNGWSTAAKPFSTLWAEGEGANREAKNGGERYERSEAKGSHRRSFLDRNWWPHGF